MCVFNNFFSYTLRSTINLAIVSMVVPEVVQLNNKTSVCGTKLIINETNYEISTFTTINSTNVVNNFKRFEWSQTLQGVLLGAYFFGYIFSNVNAEQWSNKIGCRLMLTLAMSLSSICTLLIPLMAYQHVYFVIAARFILGLSQAT